jgi:hypothetical protein
MPTVTGSVKHQGAFSQTAPSTLPATTPATSISVPQSWSFSVTTSGTAADQTDLKYTQSLSLAASPTTLDLTNLTDVYGNTVNFKRVRSFAIRMKDTTDSHTLAIGNAASNAWTGFLGSTSVLTMQASSSANDSYLVLTAPNTTGFATGSTNKNVKLDPGANTFTVEIEITGCSV